MNSEHLLDAIGLVDDDLIREAEAYRPSRRNYSRWLSLAACLAVVLVLGYGLTHIRMGGGSAAPSAPSAGTPAASAPAASTPAASTPAGGESEIPGNGCSFDAAVEIFGMESGQTPAIMVDGTVYRYDLAGAVIRPEESELRDSTSYTDGEPSEDGQINFPRENVRYMVLEDGTVALNWNGSYEWFIFVPAE